MKMVSIVGVVVAMALGMGMARAGVMTTPPSNLNDYVAITFVPNEDNPTIKANGLLLSGGNVWVEKNSPIFETEFSGYDYPFTLHNLNNFSGVSSGSIVVGFGDKGWREVNYFGEGYQWYPWFKTSQLSGSVPEPSSVVAMVLGVLGLVGLRRMY
jgi:hypothetical protein